ncbi:MAG: DinB family protein [Thermoplasmata archaeon]|nr:DinB family protein [Thermoplasmata archaeon]
MPHALQFGPEDARAIVAYNREVFGRFAARIRRLPFKEATRPRGIGHESLFSTLVHILNVQEVWLAYILRGRSSDAELEALFGDARRKPTSWKGFDEYSRRVWDAVDASIRRETQRTLGRTVKVFWMPGRYTARDGLLQSTIEEAHHLGEIIGALWQDDRKPPDMTWIQVTRGAQRPRGR